MSSVNAIASHFASFSFAHVLNYFALYVTQTDNEGLDTRQGQSWVLLAPHIQSYRLRLAQDNAGQCKIFPEGTQHCR